ncbi:MAG: ECF transporter S component [Epulopiscium sp.]|jgi:uncharacterized membrane protein|nr:ECF transporter S component [Candidatus Epulonipiscium sp.]
MKMTTKELCLKGLMIALVALSTMVFQVPVSATQGYIHLGDSMILLISVFFGWQYGMVAGGVGSALADILTGYAHWAPFTLIIKGAMGYIVGKYAKVITGKALISFRNVGVCVAGVIWMVFGYFIGGGILKSSFAVALTSVPENIVQGSAGLIIFFVVGAALNRIPIHKYLSVNK